MSRSSVAAPDGPAPAMAAAAAASAAPAPGSQAGRFVCAICSQCFQRKNGLSRHMRSHTGEKPFACSYCHFKSTRTDSLQRHMKLHLHATPHGHSAPTTLTAALSQAASTAVSSAGAASQPQAEAQARAQAQAEAHARAPAQGHGHARAQVQGHRAQLASGDAPAMAPLTPSRPTVLLPQSSPPGPHQPLVSLPPPPPAYYPMPHPPPSAPDAPSSASADSTPYHGPQPLPYPQPPSHHHQHAPSYSRHHPYFVPQPRRHGVRSPSPPAHNQRPAPDAVEMLTTMASTSPAPSESDQDIQDAALLHSIGRSSTPDMTLIASHDGMFRTGDLAGFIPCVHDDDVDFSRLIDHSLDDETNLGFAKFVQSALHALAPVLAAEARNDATAQEPHDAQALHTLANAAGKEAPLGAAQIQAFAVHFSPSMPFIHSTFLSSTVDKPAGLGINTLPGERAEGAHPFAGIGTREDQDLLWAMALVGAQYTSPPPRAHGLMALKASLARSVGSDATALGVKSRSRTTESLRQAQALILVSLLSLCLGTEEGANHARLFHAAAVRAARTLSLLPEVEGDDWSAWIMRVERRRTLWAIWVCDLLQVILIPARPWLSQVDPTSLCSETQWAASDAQEWRKAMGHGPSSASSGTVGLSPALGLRHLSLAPPASVRPGPASLSSHVPAGWEGQVSDLLSLVAYTTVECSRDWDTRAVLLGDQDATDDLTRDLTALDDRASQTIAQVGQALHALPPLSRGLASPRFRELSASLLSQLETRLHTMRETDPLRLLARVSRGVPSRAEPRGVKPVLSFLGAGGWTVLFPPLS